MTDRVNGPKPAAPTSLPARAPKPAAAAAAAAGLGLVGDRAASSGAAGALMHGAAARLDEGLPTAPALGLGGKFPASVLDAATSVRKRYGLLELLREPTWENLKGTLADFFYGGGEALEKRTSHEFPGALAKTWRGAPRPDADPALPPAAHEELRRHLELLLDPRCGGAADQGPGLDPDRAEAAAALARKVRQALAPDDLTVLADPAQRAVIADRMLAQLTRAPKPAAEGDGFWATLRQGLGALDPAMEAVRVARIVSIARMPEPDRARFEALRARFADSPQVRDALDHLAATGALRQEDKLGAGTTLDHLEAIAEGPLAPAAAQKRDDLLGETIMELAEPNAVAQRGRNTCGASNAQALLARMAPAEYARLVAGLAGPDGEVETVTGKRLARDPDWTLDDTSKSSGLPRTTSSRLLQPAIMDLGSDGDYDNVSDEDAIGMGTRPWGVVKYMEALTGEAWKWTSTLTGWGTSEMADELKAATPEHPVMIALNYNDKGETTPEFHWVRVVGYQEGLDRLVVCNTQRGTEETFDYEDLRSRMFCAVYEDR